MIDDAAVLELHTLGFARRSRGEDDVGGVLGILAIGGGIGFVFGFLNGLSKLAEALSRQKGPVVLVTNEVGLGIVPDNALARQFRDAAGILNQMVARVADEVEFVVAGLPMRVK